MDYDMYAEMEYLRQQIGDMLEDADLDQLRQLFEMASFTIGAGY